MRTPSFRTLVLGAVAAGLTLGMQACANGTGDAAAAPGEPVAATKSAAASPHVPGAPCTNVDVSVEITLQPAREDGAQRGLVAVTNKSDSDCGVNGRAAISLRNAAGEVVDVPVKNVNQPGAAVPTMLKAGSSAFQGIKWVPCDKGDAGCGTGNTLSFNLQASTDGPAAKLIDFPAPEQSAITMTSLQVGTLQPATQGVVAW
ncbi:hypothetical protein Aab01nite_58400 [Paractinoplanes abujensis]|uniref:DUF4232 domain-containing protein n=1 Tax=Paractinoplanes abujensis TaxID=882441 RepID=A0A7W7CX53_9ACTN|nr:DUF4232 domain-containing protein [Actinoplanes abujensis]MBB4696257.1 hypothetical protein [Actinoplanes abujensis]GID22250.1 hypothetical protein Aab01nite_58400 [Actinoplanes abujensis]